MLPLGKNYILDLCFLCHRTEPTKAREVRIYISVSDVHLTCVKGKCLLFGGKSKQFSLRSFSDFHQYSFSTLFKECIYWHMDDCGEEKIEV